MKANPNRFWIIVILLGWMFDFLFWQKPFGLNFFIYIALCLITGVYLLNTDGLRLAPFIGIGCPGLIEEDGSITRGGQNLPGNWSHKKFNLPQLVRLLLPRTRNPAAKNREGKTPRDYAAANGHDDVVQLLKRAHN